MSSFDGKVAVITGAGSDMALARNLAKKGAKLALSTSTLKLWPIRFARPKRWARR